MGLVIGETDDVEKTTKGFRFMGQRFVPDAYIFRELIWRNVGTNDQPRQLPNGLDVMAAMGSDRAYIILDNLGETAYANYPEQMTKMRDWTSSLTANDWTETLYNGWLYTLQPLFALPGDGYPQFMQSDAWLDKQLSTSLGSWAELKHDTILYAKQAYAELGGGGSSTARSNAIAKRGIRNVLMHAGIMSGTMDSGPSIMLDMPSNDCFTFSEHDGLFEICVDLGEHVREGQTVGYLHHLERPDRAPEEIVAQGAGYLITMRAPCLTQQGDCVAVIAKQVSEEEILNA